MYMSQSMFNTLYASVHTEKKKNFISKSIFLLKRMLFAKQHCHWPPVPNFDHKHAMSDMASYANSHHTLKKKKGEKGEGKRRSGHASLYMYSWHLKKPRKLDKLKGPLVLPACASRTQFIGSTYTRLV